MTDMGRVAEQLLCLSGLSASGPIVEWQVLDDRGPKPQVGFRQTSQGTA